MSVSAITKVTLVNSVVYFEAPKAPVIQIGQVVTVANCNSLYFNQAWTVLGTGSFIIPIGGVNQLWQGFSATSVPPVGSPFALSAAANASGGNTTYTGTFGTLLTSTIGQGQFGNGLPVTIAGFVINSVNNGTFTIGVNNATQMTVNNPNGVAETQAATASVAAPVNSVGLGPLNNLAVEIENTAVIINIQNMNSGLSGNLVPISSTPLQPYQLS